MRRRNVAILEKLRREGGGPNVVGAHSLEKFIHNQAMREERLKGIEEEIRERLQRERAQTREAPRSSIMAPTAPVIR